MPGTAAEILDDEVRKIISPNKLRRDRWVEIVTAAHEIGLRSTSTIMYGHIEQPRHIAAHLALIRDLQKRTGGFTEFVPLGFIHEKNVLFNHMHARPGASMPEDLRMIAVSRLFLRPWIQNVQMSWVKMGPKVAQMALLSGANDFGGTLMEESISRESGADFGENLPAEEMRRLIREVGRTPVQRSTTYEILARYDDPEQDPPSLEPVVARELSGPTRWRLAQERFAAKGGAGRAQLADARGRVRRRCRARGSTRIDPVARRAVLRRAAAREPHRRRDDRGAHRLLPRGAPAGRRDPRPDVVVGVAPAGGRAVRPRGGSRDERGRARREPAPQRLLRARSQYAVRSCPTRRNRSTPC